MYRYMTISLMMAELQISRTVCRWSLTSEMKLNKHVSMCTIGIHIYEQQKLILFK